MQAGWKRALFAAAIVLASAAGVIQADEPDAQSAQSAGPQQKAATPEKRVDINHATVSQLLQVPGMTETWAARIVRFRPYRTKQDLIDKGVVTSQVYDRIKDYVIAHREKE